jgi:hypothetical protein
VGWGSCGQPQQERHALAQRCDLRQRQVHDHAPPARRPGAEESTQEDASSGSAMTAGSSCAPCLPERIATDDTRTSNLATVVGFGPMASVAISRDAAAPLRRLAACVEL